MWHELVLCGVGGHTIAQAKRNLSWQEAMQWKAYMGRRGTLNVGLRNEALIANVAMLITSAAKLTKQDGSAFSASDFMPHVVQQEEQELTPEAAFETLMKISRHA